jgi:Tfp pilus assembly PilM family ATPase
MEALRTEFSIPVEVLNPFHRIQQNAEISGSPQLASNTSQLAVAVGLALRSFDAVL